MCKFLVEKHQKIYLKNAVCFQGIGFRHCLAAAKSLVDKDALVVRQTLDVVCGLFSICDSQSEWSLTKKQKLVLLQAVLSCLLKKKLFTHSKSLQLVRRKFW
jgi:hypothetical protein